MTSEAGVDAPITCRIAPKHSAIAKAPNVSGAEEGMDHRKFARILRGGREMTMTARCQRMGVAGIFLCVCSNPTQVRAQWEIDRELARSALVAKIPDDLIRGLLQDERGMDTDNLNWLADNKTLVLSKSGMFILLDTAQKVFTANILPPQEKPQEQEFVLPPGVPKSELRIVGEIEDSMNKEIRPVPVFFSGHMGVSADGTTIAATYHVIRESPKTGVAKSYYLGIWNADGKFIRSIPIDAPVRSLDGLTLTPDGKTVVVSGHPSFSRSSAGSVSMSSLLSSPASSGFVICLIDTANATVKKTFQVPLSSVTGISISSDGRFLVTVNKRSNDNTLILWNLETGEALPIPAHFGCATAAFSPVKPTLIALYGRADDGAGHSQHLVLFWDLATTKVVYAVPFERELKAMART